MRDHVILQSAQAIYDIRMGDWKLVERANPPQFESVRNKRKAEHAVRMRKRAARHDELYNLREDPAESKNVASANAERTATMKQVLAEARARGFFGVRRNRIFEIAEHHIDFGDQLRHFCAQFFEVRRHEMNHALKPDR